ncbi:MAG: hypothetical protein DSY80_07435 [Desulfocapsa sp.]|nr:MAG: hypothetical protein DSY80_07435 [Desulfocapsa sp.]
MKAPHYALSVRQPWAWAIIHGGKDIENRSWSARGPNIKHHVNDGGHVCIHAAKGMTRAEYREAYEFMESLGVSCPPAADLLRGGIIGSVSIVRVTKKSSSPWFFGPLGLVLTDPKEMEFIPSKGRLGYFRWQPDSEESIPKPNRWMLKKI